jgi:hypothetical protein
MATIPYKAAGVALTYQAATGGGDKYAAGSGRLHVRNGDGSAITVTIVGQQFCNQGTKHDLTYTVAGASDKILGPFDTTRFDDGTGFIQITYSAVTSVTVAVIA